MTTQEPFVPVPPPSTTTTTTTSTTTACSSTPVADAINLSAYKGVGIGIPAFTFRATVGNPGRVRALQYRIKDLPAAGDGILYLNNVAVLDEAVISIADNGKLVYVPKPDADASATFNYLVETNCGTSANAAVTIAVTDKPVDDDCDCNTTTSTTTTTV